jgi:hypothetical protein
MTISESVTVGIVDSTPKYVIWKGRNYTIDKVGLHHTYRKGHTLYHIFSITADTLFMRLKFNTENLGWRLEEISDGLAD